MANQTCYSSIQVLAMRVSKLDINGQALAGASSGYTYGNLIEANVGVDVENGVEIVKKNGADVPCVNFRGDDYIKRVNITLKLCTLDSELLQLLIGSQRIINGSTTIGGRLLAIAEPAPFGCCLEIWTRAWNGSNAAQPSVLGTQNAYWHLVFPKAKFQLDPTDFKDDAADIGVKGFGYENARMNIDGPYNDWPSSVGSSGGFQSAMGWFVDTALPTAQCGFTTVPAQGS